MRTAICLVLLLPICNRSVAAPEADTIGWSAAGKGGAVAAGGSGAVAAGIRLLQQGGNAADAAVATVLALSVTDYGLFAIGGEVPMLIYSAEKREVKVLCGLGRAPLDQAAIDWYYAHGIPSKGSIKAAPVPGAVDLCVTALRLYGTKSFAEAVAPTLALLDAGKLDWHPNLAVTLRKLVEAETNAAGTRDQKLAAVSNRFYRGDVADELEKWYIATGAFLRKRDLAAHKTLVEDPVVVNYRGYSVYKCGPWTQGPMLCQTLRLLEGFDLKAMGHLSADYIHVVTEALKLGFADRDEFYGDPLFVDVPLGALLSDRYTSIRRPLIDPARASLQRRPGDPQKMQPLKARSLESREPPADRLQFGSIHYPLSTLHSPISTIHSPPNIPVQDTTTCVVADRWGNVVAATPSCNFLTNRPGPSGVNHGNRLRCLNTTPGHPNRVQPGKRPRITLTPTLVLKDGKPGTDRRSGTNRRLVVAISVAGGDLQDQTTLNVLLNHIEFGMFPDKAVTAPRFSTAHHQDSFDPNPDRQAAFIAAGSLQLSSSVAEEVRTELSKRGHKLSTTSGPIAHPVMIYIDPHTSTIHAAGDPTAGRHAAALD